jgi:hypothetical protein
VARGHHAAVVLRRADSANKTNNIEKIHKKIYTAFKLKLFIL